jgi:hypothetical protein
MLRTEDWHKKLEAYFRGKVGVPFAWGKNDCALFAADAALSITGVDMGVELRGKYSTEPGAKAFMEQLAGPGSGVAEVAALLLAQYGAPKLAAPLLAHRGDLVLLPHEEFGEGLGVVSLDGRKSLTMGSRGPVKWPVSRAIAAWRIGAEPCQHGAHEAKGGAADLATRWIDGRPACEECHAKRYPSKNCK